MKDLLKTNKDWNKHLKTMEYKLGDNPFRHSDNKPNEFPCIVVSFIASNVDGYKINHEFVYKGDFK